MEAHFDTNASHNVSTQYILFAIISSCVNILERILHVQIFVCTTQFDKNVLCIVIYLHKIL